MSTDLSFRFHEPLKTSLPSHKDPDEITYNMEFIIERDDVLLDYFLQTYEMMLLAANQE